MFCFLISTSFLWFDDCISEITIFNKLPSDITVTIDGKSKRLLPWGSCKGHIEDETYQIVPCVKTWKIEWESDTPLTFIDYCLSDYDEDEDAVEDWDEEEHICDDYEVDVEFKGVKGLDRPLTLSAGEHYSYVLSTNGFKRLSDDQELDQP